MVNVFGAIALLVIGFLLGMVCISCFVMAGRLSEREEKQLYDKAEQKKDHYYDHG